MKYLVSSCLLGLKTRYDGDSNLDGRLVEFLKDHTVIPFCPEEAGGLSTPRPPSEIQGGDGFDVLKGKARVVTIDGEDVTGEFIRGAQETLKLMELTGAKLALLKSKSPSCGCKSIYDGSFSSSLRPGVGVTAAYLHSHGIRVLDADEFTPEGS